MSRRIVTLLVSVALFGGCRPTAERDGDIARDAAPQTRACTGEDLRARAKWGAATGSIGGSWGVVNDGPACSIRLPLSAAVSAGSEVIGSAKTGRPGRVVELGSGARLSFVFLWSNWCGKTGERFSVELSFETPESKLHVEAPGPPFCAGGSESNVSVTSLKVDEAR